MMVESQLKISATRRAWEWDYVSDIRHAGDELNDALQSKPKAGMRDRAVSP